MTARMNARKAPDVPLRIFLGIATALGVLALGAGCSGRPRSLLPPPAAPPSPPLTPPPDPGTAASDDPVRWVYHPDSHAPALAIRPLEEGGCLFTAQHGQRWLTRPAAARKAGQRDSAASATDAAAAPVESCGEKAKAASDPAPEELIAISRLGEHAFRFVGQSGAIYEAPEPLAPLLRVSAAPNQTFVKASGEGEVVLGVTLEGKLFRFTGPGGYQQVALTPSDGRLFDVAMGSRGRALALSGPETLFTSGDGGVTWERARVPTIGVQRVRRTPSGSLLAEGLMGSYEWSDKLPLTASPSRMPGKLPSRKVESTLDIPPIPSAGAIKYGGVAVLDDDRYAEVREPEDKEGAWRLLRGKLDGHLDVTPLPQSKGCTAVALGGRGKYLFTSWLSEDRNAVEVRRSMDFGETWSAPLTLTGSTSPVTIGVSPRGNALITGVCVPDAMNGTATNGNGKECEPTAPLRVEANGATLQATATVAPELQAKTAYSPAYAVDGRSAYFLAGDIEIRDVAQKYPVDLELFVSHDEGKTFSARPLKIDMPPLLDPFGGAYTYSVNLAYVCAPCAGLSPSADGTLGLWVDVISKLSYHSSKDGYRIPRCSGAYLTMDADGHRLHQVSPPAEDAMLGGFGRRLIAFAYTSKEGTADMTKSWNSDDGSELFAPFAELHGTTRLWESGDGGVTWKPKRLPDTLANGLMSPGMRYESVACAAGGCLVGDMLTRVGWGGPSVQARPAPTPGAGGNPSSTALTPIVCELSPGTRWASTAPLSISPNNWDYHKPLLPDAHVAMRGRSVWSSLMTDPATGAVSAMSATLPESGEGAARITTQPLLGPAKASSPGMRFALHQAYEREGYIALRAAFTLDEYGRVSEGAMVRDAEVAWENYMDGTSGHGRVPDAVASKFTSSHATTLFYSDLTMRGTSMKVGGVAVMPNGKGKDWSPAFTLDAKGHIERVLYPSVTFHRPGDSSDDDKSLTYAEPDLVRAGGKLLGVRLMRQGMEDNDDRGSSWHVHQPNSNALVVLLGRPTGPAAAAPRQGVDPWAWSTFTFTPSGDSLARPYASDAYWTYAGKTTLGLVSFVVEKRKGRAYASFYALRADGTLAPPVPVATLSDLGDQPRACTAVERATSARLVSAMHWEGRESEALFPGLQHPVMVREATGPGAVAGSAPVALTTGAAVTYGTPSSACVAAWEAKSPKGEEVSAIISGDLTDSWMFRLGKAQAASVRQSGEALEYRPMSCHFEPSARVAEGAGK